MYATDFDTGDNHKQGTFSFNVQIMGWAAEPSTRELVASGNAEAGYNYYAASSGGDPIEVEVDVTDVSGKYKARAAHQVALTQSMLAGVTGDYYIRVTSADQGKVSLTKTADLHTTAGGAAETSDSPSTVNFAAATNNVYGALGKGNAASDRKVDVAKIEISNTGVVTFKKASSLSGETVTWNSGETWAIGSNNVNGMNGCGTKATDYVFVGIECKAATAEDASALAAYDASFTPSVEESAAN